MTFCVLVLNCGSSSIKFQLFENGTTRLAGLVESIGEPEAKLSYQIGEEKFKQNLGRLDFATAIQKLVPVIQNNLSDKLNAIGHRVVHGGNKFTQPVLITSEVLAQIEACVPLAPLHNPANILGIKAAQVAFPQVPQVAVFDTAFHQTLPPHAFLYALPYEYYQQHQVRRYGFHGISYQYLIPKAAEILNIPLENSAFIAVHLGNGCSVCAALNGKSVDTSMGLTPLEGLVMGTRSGDLDPGLFDYLSKNLNLSLQEITGMLNKKSGLQGISNLSNDMRTLRAAAEEGNLQAKLAIEIFCYRLAKYIASYMVPLGRLDALIFSGGIGENAADVRGKTLGWLVFLGFKIDPEKNICHGARSNGLIVQDASAKVLVIKAQEELMIARTCLSLLSV